MIHLQLIRMLGGKGMVVGGERDGEDKGMEMPSDRAWEDGQIWQWY